MDQPVLQRASPVLSGVPPCRTAWGARASSIRLPTWFVTGQKDVVILLPVNSLGEWQYSRSFATMLFGTYCNALRVLQER